MPVEPVRFFDRYEQRIETEQIYGEAYLRFCYENPLGRLALWAVVKRAAFSRLYGWLMDRPASAGKIGPFLETYGVDPAEFADPPERFASFNEFFSRRLKPGARPICAGDARVAFPADGRHLGFQDLSRTAGFFVKGRRFGLAEFLGDPALAARYEAGTMVLSRLCPVDYHRFHFPVAGVPAPPRPIAGELSSVNPIALRRDIEIFVRNKRVVTRLSSPAFGEVTMVEVGATNVGTIRYTYAPGEAVEKGDEKGYFRFGGSSTVTLFEPGRVRLDGDLVAQTAAGVELYARMGDGMATREETSGNPAL